MAKGDWWFKFEYNKWRNSSELRRCSLETKGFWIELICVMRESDADSVTGTCREIARLVGCFPDEVERCLEELRATETADIFFHADSCSGTCNASCNGHVTKCNAQSNARVTVTSRYISKELKSKELTRLRVAKHREQNESNTQVTPAVTVQSKSKSKNKSKKKEKEKKEEASSTPPAEAFGQPQKRPTDFRSSSDIPLIAKTENVLKFALPIPTQERIADVVPTEFESDWIELVKDRIVGNEDSAPNYVKTKIGFWLTDIRKIIDRSPKPNGTNGHSPPEPPKRSQEELRAIFEKQAHDRPRPQLKIDDDDA
jgi:hypothetical protein